MIREEASERSEWPRKVSHGTIAMKVVGTISIPLVTRGRNVLNLLLEVNDNEVTTTGAMIMDAIIVATQKVGVEVIIVATGEVEDEATIVVASESGAEVRIVTRIAGVSRSEVNIGFPLRTGATTVGGEEVEAQIERVSLVR